MADLSATMPDQSPQELVRLALLDFLPGTVVSTRETINRVRQQDPACRASDNELVDLIIAASTGHSMTIEFDHASDAVPY